MHGVAHDHIDRRIVMIIIICVYTKNVQYLPHTGICKRMINNIVNSKTMFVLGWSHDLT